MSIRRRLLVMLLPPIIFFLIAISSFFYMEWSQEILRGFQTQILCAVGTAAETFSSQQIRWLAAHREDDDIADQAEFRDLARTLANIRKQIGVAQLSMITLEPVPLYELIDPSRPSGPKNPINDGSTPLLSHREVTLLEAKQPAKEAEVDPVPVLKLRKVKPLAWRAWQEKKPAVTPPYFSSHRKTHVMTIYTPVLNPEGETIALIAADATLQKIDYEKSRALLIIGLVSALTLFLMIACVSWVAESLSQPVRRLNAAALAIAAGEYGEQIQAEGPKEVHELANTFNTMSQCLDETMARLQESSTARDRMYGEYECSLLLQHFMLNKVVQEFSSPVLSLESIKSSTGIPSRGLLLQTDRQEGQEDFLLLESKKPGFESIYSLQSRQTDPKQFSSLLLRVFCKKFFVDIERRDFPPAFVWNRDKEQIVALESGKAAFGPGDLLFFCNHPLFEQFSGPQAFERWLGKVLRHFGKEEAHLLSSMLRNEVHFLIKKRPLMEDPVLFCLSYKTPS